MYLVDKYKGLKKRWDNSSQRSKLAAKNIVANVLLKFISILTSLMVVPLTIDYLDSDGYGIWLTISSIVGWANIFDLGIANGFRNKFAEAKAKGEILLARQYVSTTFAVISIIMAIVFSGMAIANIFIDWSEVLNVSESYEDKLHKVILILGFIFCTSMIVNVFTKLIEADQRPAISSAISGIGQLFSLLSIFILTKYTEGNIVTLATYFSGVPVSVMIIGYLILFHVGRYKKFAPSPKLIRPNLTKEIINIGFKFFFIYLCLLAIFQIMNVVLSRENGPTAVAEYNVAFKYFSMIYMVALLVIAPLWSAFTDAYTKKDFQWMKNVISKLEKCMILAITGSIILLVASPIAYRILVGDNMKISIIMSISVMAYVLIQTLAAIYMHLINGIGTIKLQFIIYFIFAIISFPALTYCCRLFGAVGIVILPSMVYLIQAIFGKIQLHKIIEGEAKGIWLE